MNIVWSYSSIKTFSQCPRKYYHLKVLKDVKDTGSEATVYGEEVHKAAELYIKDGTPVPKKFAFIIPVLESLAAIEGEKYCEVKLGARVAGTSYEACEFFAKDVWWRGISDLVIVQGDKAYSVDYKTSKNAKYADTKQLDVVAAAIFLRFPQVNTIKSGLLFVVSNEFIEKVHHRKNLNAYFSVFQPELDRLAAAHTTDVWNACSGPLCRFCVVKSCEHHKG